MNWQCSSASPRLGIALGSGAAKGWAHIGVLDELVKLGIQPHYIAGCSIGAYVGAAFANDRLDELGQWVQTLTNWQVVKLLDLGIHHGGLLLGKKVFAVTEALLGSRRIESSRLPFAAVATELYTGKEVWLKRGNMRRAVRASCAMPGLFSPIRWHGRWLIDGAISNPVPVSLCRAMGASHVIAVDLQANRISQNAMANTPILLEDRRVPTEELARQESLFARAMGVGQGYFHSVVDRIGRHKKPKDLTKPNMMAVMSGALDILEDKLKRSRMAGDPPEVLITPKVADIGLMEFFRAQEAIEAGRQAVRKQAEVLEVFCTRG
ncbi:patatin-like phospholipase RssA [Celerinatantimonas diazotrophica]|uniref:NTE family protein n=1 Tax=Celerinatantimonas diazotrophica TaxID=412034 RepID=A0A4R1K3P3_9GAMM|nr:patatin-like phospholipase RssA [Celerinatantimonas diazotrophica]TCK58517.1 NTE family protein [Celerinatantimonas diazotrophica]CAG9297146.1 putative NTE family protein [Celerinatantimonas diazotrophica]